MEPTLPPCWGIRGRFAQDVQDLLSSWLSQARPHTELIQLEHEAGMDDDKSIVTFLEGNPFARRLLKCSIQGCGSGESK